MKSNIVQKIGLVTGIGISVSVSAALIRYLLAKEKKIETLDCHTNPIEMKLEIPRKSLGYIIGKRGATIQKIRERTDTTIRVIDQNDEMAVVVIRGQKRKAESAEREIKNILNSLPKLFTKEVILPESSWLAVVGVHGDNVRSISSESKAELTVKWCESTDNGSRLCSKYVVTIRGSSEQIARATSLIDEHIAQENVSQQSQPVSLAGKSFFYNMSSKTTVSQEVFPTNTVDGFTEVFVSAVQSPGHFWVQLCGPKSIQLDKLTREMTEFYRNEMDFKSYTFRIQSVIPGELVAVYNGDDNEFYRALVLTMEQQDEEVITSVLYVDFGDSGVVELQKMYRLKPEYISMPLQAIKCSLHDVMPINEDRWTMEAINLFGKISHLGDWKPIMAKAMLSSKQTNDDNNPKSNQEADIVEISLIDTNGPADVDIVEKLVEEGYAIRKSKINCNDK